MDTTICRFLAGAASLLFLAEPVLASITRFVTNLNDSGPGSLRDAIAISGGGDTINFSVTGTITLTSDELSINHNLTIIGPGAPSQLIITRSSSAAHFRIFYFDNGTWTLSNVTVSNGYQIQGGGIYNGNGNLTLSNCVISGNTASFDGGGIYSKATTSAQNCTITGNTAFSYNTNDPRLDGGGGIYNSGTLTLTDSTIDNNTDNNLGENGGGIYNAGNATVQNCTFYRNTANGTSTTYHNLGGAIFNHAGSLTVYNCTFSQNSATNSSGGCIFNWSGASAGVGSSIFAGSRNLDASVGGNPIVSAGYNLSTDDGTGGDGTLYLGATGDKTNSDPKFDSNGLQYNGGYTDTIALTYGSPAIDAGKSFGTTSDQRGQPRPVDNPNVANASDGSDIGAYESPADPLENGLVVNTLADHDDGTCGGSDCTLREAIARANSLGGGEIFFATGLTGTITLQTSPFELGITTPIDIYGPGARVLAISGNGVYRVFNFSGGTSTVSGLTIRNANYVTTQNHGETRQGGAVYNQANVTFNECAFINNFVSGASNVANGGNGGTGQGGAIFNGGHLTLNSCTLSGNTAGGVDGTALTPNGTLGPGGNGGLGQGGAVFNDASGMLSLTTSTINGNTALGGKGGSGTSGTKFAAGGSANGGAVFNRGTMSISSVTVSGNSGTGGAGAGTRFNHGPNGGGNGGMSAGGGTSGIDDTIVAGNTGNTAPDAEGTFSSGGFNLIGIGDQSSGFNANFGDLVGTTTSPLNPQLGSLQNNGGPTDTMILLYGSPAIDQGYSPDLTSDQRGISRPIVTIFFNFNSADGSDIGAVEMNLVGGPDSDGDGMSDDFEKFFGFNPNNPADGNVDSDGDGLTNLQEFEAGTNPLDPASGFGITAVAKNEYDFVVTFGIVLPSRTYRLERKDALTDSFWSSINGVSDLRPNSVGTGQITDPGGASVSKHFYHVRILP